MLIAEPITKANVTYRMLHFRNREVWKEQAKRQGYVVEAVDDVGDGYLIAYDWEREPVGAMPWHAGCSDRTPVNQGWMTVTL